MDSRQILEFDKAFIWHPYSRLGIDNLLVKSASGASIILDNKKEIIDAVSSWWVNLHGHSNPYITEALKKQSDSFQQVIFSGFTHGTATKLVELLSELLNDKLYKYFFSDNGSTAVETALKLVVKYWDNRKEKRTKFISILNAYHGDTVGAMSVSHRGVFNSIFKDLLFDTHFLPVPDGQGKAIEALEKIILKEKCAGFIFESLVQGAGGMNVMDKNELSALIKLCKKNEIPTIGDEVFTGIYRTGKAMAYKHLEVVPDIICLSKALTAGYCSIGMTCISEDIAKYFLKPDYADAFFHGHSYTGNALSAAVAVASLELCKHSEFEINLRRIELAHETFASHLKQIPFVSKVRTLGLILAFNVDFGTDEYLNPIRDKIIKMSLDKGVLLRPLGNVIYIVPPVCITTKQLEHVYSVILEVLDHLLKQK